MSGIKKFLNNRAKGIAKENAIKNGIDYVETTTKTVEKTIISPEVGFEIIEEEVPLKEENLDLTDDEFWDISNSFNKQLKISKSQPEEILQKILESYSPLKIKQFAQRYKELNS